MTVERQSTANKIKRGEKIYISIYIYRRPKTVKKSKVKREKQKCREKKKKTKEHEAVKK